MGDNDNRADDIEFDVLAVGQLSRDDIDTARNEFIDAFARLVHLNRPSDIAGRADGYESAARRLVALLDASEDEVTS